MIGNPSGFFGTVSEGIVSGFRKRSWDVLLMQITAPISPGSSGSPVLDENGEIVGIATLTRAGQNLNFAIAGREIAVLLIEAWTDKYPGGPEMKAKITEAIGEHDLTLAQEDTLKSIIEQHLPKRQAIENDRTLPLAAKEEAIDQLWPDYQSDILEMLTPEQQDRFMKASPEIRQDFVCPPPPISLGAPKSEMRRYEAYMAYCKRHGKEPCHLEYEENKWMQEEK